MLSVAGHGASPSEAAGPKVQGPGAPAHCAAGLQSHREDAQSEAVSTKPEGTAEEQSEESGAGSGGCTGRGVRRACPGHTAAAFYGWLWEWQVSAEKAMTQD